MYHACGLIKPDTDFSVQEAFTRLKAKFPDFSVTCEGEQITIAKGDWWIALVVVSGPGVADETQGIVDRIAGLEQSEAEAYVSTGRRVEVWSDVPDPFMEHFDDYLKMIEVLKSFNGLLAVDPKEPGVL